MTHGYLNLKIIKSFSKKKSPPPPAKKIFRYAKQDIFLALEHSNKTNSSSENALSCHYPVNIYIHTKYFVGFSSICVCWFCAVTILQNSKILVEYLGWAMDWHASKAASHKHEIDQCIIYVTWYYI